MRFPMPAVLALVLLPACVTEQVSPPPPVWEFSADQPVVAVAGEPPAALPPAQDVPVGPDGQEAPQGPTPDLLHLLQPATEEAQEPDYLAEAPPTPFHRLGRNVIRGVDGSWSKMYMIKSERAAGVLAVLQASVPGFPAAANTPSPPEGLPTEIIKYVHREAFYKDSTFTANNGAGSKLGILESLPNLNVADLLVITAPPEVLLFVDQLLDKLLADLPQVELQVRLVEVNLDDLLDWDAKVAANHLENPGQPFDPVSNPINGNFGAGFPIEDNGAPSGYGAAFGSFVPPTSITGFLLSLQGVHNGVQVDALLSFLQTIGASEIISTPTVTVLNGHRAVINTGSKVPVFSATGLGSNAQVTTTFEDTGVRVELIPFIVADDVVRIDLSVDVSAVTGEVPFVLSGVEVSTPVISTRDAGTTVHVHSGQVFAVGGLRSRESIESITKVPILGDIPVLGWLFKSRSSRVRNSEILFFITPTIRIPSESLVAPLGP